MFDANAIYENKDPQLDKLALPQTRAKWRHEGRGPAYIKSGSRVLYKGSDILSWLESRRVPTADTPMHEIVVSDETKRVEADIRKARKLKAERGNTHTARAEAA